MNKRRRIDKSKYLTVFAMTTLVFIIGISVGNFFSGEKLKQIEYIGQDLKTDTVAMELQYELIAENPCDHVNSSLLADELYEMASKLDYMENQMGEDDRSVMGLKEYYSLLEIRHWLFMKKTAKQCNQTGERILFFYTNEDDCKRCKEQGFILTWIRSNYEDVYIYSFDHTIENAALDTIKRMYSIEGTPSMIVGKETYNRFMSKKDIEKLLIEQGIERIK